MLALLVPAQAGNQYHSDARAKTQPWILGLGYERMANILTCCSWPNNWGIREACPKICRKRGGGLWGDQGWAGVGCSGSAARELAACWSNLLLRLAEAQVLGHLTWLPPGMGGSLLLGIYNLRLHVFLLVRPLAP